MNQKAELINSEKVKFEKFDFFDQFSYKNFSHVDSLVNGLDIIGQMHNLSISIENGGEWMVIPNDSHEEGFRYVFSKIVDWMKESSWFLVKIVIAVLLGLLLLFILGKLLLLFVKNRLTSHRVNVPSVVYNAEASNTQVQIIDPSPELSHPLSAQLAVPTLPDRIPGKTVFEDDEEDVVADLGRFRSASVNTIAYLNTGRNNI